MVRPWMIILGIGLLLVWLAGVGYHTASWLCWLDFVGGMASIAGGLFAPPDLPRNARMAMPLALSVMLFLLWIISLAVGHEAWKVWWTFAFACGYLLLAALSGTPTRRQTERMPPQTA